MAFDITKELARQLGADAGAPRSIEPITSEILRLKEDAGNAIIAIGQRLNEAKALLSHSEWLPWLTEQVEFSERSAQRFMRLAREWSNPTALSDLGATKALTLLALPPEEREQFMQETHSVDGQKKTVIDMTSRELEKAIRERDEAKKAAEAARAEAAHAEESRAKMETDMEALKTIHALAQEAESQARQELEKARAELKAFQEKPVDVAVMAVDQEAIEQAKKEAVAEVQSKLDKAVEARKKAEEKRKSLEEQLEAAQKRLDEASAAKKRAALSGDKDFGAFELLFSQTEENINRIIGLLMKFRGRGDVELAEDLQKALLVLSERVRRFAE